MSMHSKDGEGLLKRCGRAISFLFRSIRHPIKMGAPLPCTKQISDTIMEELSAVDAKTVVELGTGLGSLTRGILEALPDDGKLLCVEREAPFCAKLRERFGDKIELVEDNAIHLTSILEGTEWESPDAIVCSVPLIIDESDELLDAIGDNLPTDGLYLQVANFSKPIEARFHIQKSYFFPTNIPPERLHSAVQPEAVQ
ncbi:MAG: class I SAM-dependent methyltransferase [Planctomycetota bacterium]